MQLIYRRQGQKAAISIFECMFNTCKNVFLHIFADYRVKTELKTQELK